MKVAMSKEHMIKERDYLIDNLMIINGKINNAFPFDSPKLTDAAEKLENQISQLNKLIK